MSKHSIHLRKFSIRQRKHESILKIRHNQKRLIQGQRKFPIRQVHMRV